MPADVSPEHNPGIVEAAEAAVAIANGTPKDSLGHYESRAFAALVAKVAPEIARHVAPLIAREVVKTLRGLADTIAVKANNEGKWGTKDYWDGRAAAFDFSIELIKSLVEDESVEEPKNASR